MKTTVKLRHIKQSATKVRFVLKQVTGLSVSKALDRLRFANKKASVFIYKALNSGISNLSTLKYCNAGLKDVPSASFGLYW